jgi:hypothetical protein
MTMEYVRDYELKAFFAYVIEVLERLEIPYRRNRTNISGMPAAY